jgi:thiol-disulfide isomerase/thioredoxin
MNNWQRLASCALALGAVAMVFAGIHSPRTEAGGKMNPQALVGKPAPDFRGDFAVNGKPTKLSELKGKVVVLEFWAFWCKPCIGTFPYLIEWRDKYKSKGLEVVGVTLYSCELPDKFAFDKDTAKVVAVKQTTKETEQDSLREFAAHHKLNFLLMAMPKDEALQTFQDYGVIEVPHLVVIDQKGIVRQVRVGGTDANAKAVEEEFRGLLK